MTPDGKFRPLMWDVSQRMDALESILPPSRVQRLKGARCRAGPPIYPAVPIGCVMIQSLPRAAGCYATATQFVRELRAH